MKLEAIDLVRGDRPLPMLSDVYQQFNACLDKPGATALDFSEILSKDPVLTLKVLKLVNSAYYGLRSQVDNVAQAVTIVGLNELRDLVLSVCVMEFFDGLPEELASLKDFWRHSVLCSLIAKKLQKASSLKLSESMFTAGLLHDVGSLIILLRMPEIAKGVLDRAVRQNADIYLLEQQELGFDHADVSGALIEHWGLPEFLIEVCRAHHQPVKTARFTIEARFLYLCDLFAYDLLNGVTAQTLADKHKDNEFGLSASLISQALSDASEELNSVLKSLIH